METEVVVHQQVRTWLERSILQPYLSELHSHFQRGRYAASTQHIYLYCIAHFASWITRRRLELARLDERVIACFVAEHLPHCDCLDPVRRSRGETRTALRHLMQTLRACGAMPANSGNADSLQVELSCFDHYMDQVRGLAPNTRRQRLRIVQRFLVERFASRPIVFTSIHPADVRGFVLGHHAAYSTGTMQVIGGAIRCYLRYRSIAGDPAQRLLSAVPSVANWRLATLPQVLSEREVQQLLESVKRLPSSAKRAYAMVRCLTDLGLRASEVVQLQLCDIDWHVGTIRLTANKSRRVDILPLPVETGRAIAEYLRSERPQTTDRAVFVRHGAPFAKPIQAGVVRRAVRQGYRRCALAYSRVHILRHSLASRLLRVGTPLKEIADILRHRSLDTSVIYTKIDTNRLSAVAMPWPGRSL